MLLNSSNANMFWSEEVGLISKSEDQGNRLWWTLPHCFAYGGERQRTDNASLVVCSPFFTSYNTKWRLALIRSETNTGSYVGLFLWKIEGSYHCLSDLSVKLGIKFSNSELPENVITGELNSYGCFGKWNFGWYNTFRTNKEEFAADGFLRFFCEMRLKTETPCEVTTRSSDQEEKDTSEDQDIPKDNKNVSIPESRGVDKLVQDLQSLLLNEQWSDVTLKVDDREFKVHRNILTVRSPVFASMLQQDTKENATSVIDIPNCSAEVFQVFLSYVYTGTADTLSSDNVFDVYYTANTYQVNDLKFECMKYMEENISIENFFEIMKLNYVPSESGLQKKATSFFSDNVKFIIKTDQWQQYMKDYTEQANELLIKTMNA